jgi:hypothetical protein
MSDYGTRLVSADGRRQVDNKHMVPQLIATSWCGDFPAYDALAQSGFWTRVWAVQRPQAVMNRPCIVFFSLPKAQNEVYYTGSRCIFKPGATPEPPTIYYFALDYVSYGNQRYGRRSLGPTGQLLYDSGNCHLSIDQMFTGLTHNMTWTTPEAGFVLNGFGPPKGVIPDSPAICVDEAELYASWGNKSGIAQARARMFYRFLGDQLQSIFSRYEFTEDESIKNRTPYNHIVMPAQPRNVMVIDRYQHQL